MRFGTSSTKTVVLSNSGPLACDWVCVLQLSPAGTEVVSKVIKTFKARGQFHRIRPKMNLLWLLREQISRRVQRLPCWREWRGAVHSTKAAFRACVFQIRADSHHMKEPKWQYASVPYPIGKLSIIVAYKPKHMSINKKRRVSCRQCLNKNIDDITM